MKDFKKILKKKGAKASSIKFFEEMARELFQDFLDFFHKDLYEKIDFEQPYEFLDEAMPYFLPAKYAFQKDAFNLFVKAKNKQGEDFYFLLDIIFAIEKGDIRIGVADVPEKAIKAYEESKAKKALEKPAKTPKKLYEDKNQCSVCGRTDLPLTFTIEAMTMDMRRICSVCMHNNGPSGEEEIEVSLEELDEDIAKYEEMAKMYEDAIKKSPESYDLPEDIEPYLITPMSAYKGIQAIIADLRSQRMKALTKMDSEVRLNYELEKALAAEDYALSAEIRDKLSKIKK